MKLFKVSSFVNEDVCTPHEMNLELGTIAQEFNGRLDLENLAASSVTSAKLARNQDWIKYRYLTHATDIRLDPNQSARGQVYRLPRSTTSTTEMRIEFPAVEGAVMIRGGATMHAVTPGSTNISRVWSLVFMVDGKIIWESGTCAAYANSSRDGEVAFWVGPGTRLIEMGVRLHDEDAQLVFASGNLLVKQYKV